MLRPVSFSLPSSTELKISFNKDLTDLLSQDNFVINSVSGNIDDLEVLSASVDGSTVIVRTRPMVAGNFYMLRLLDADSAPFESSGGSPLINDDVSRDLYFVGLKNYNPIRDRMLSNVPKLYDLEDTKISKLIGAQAEEILQAQKHIGEVLSDNYISIDVDDERRVRSSGATDRFANEGVYAVSRVAPNRAGTNLTFGSLDYSSESGIPDHYSVPNYPISLQEVFVDSEEISISSKGNWFKGFLLSLEHKNIIKVTSLRHVRPDDVADCDGVIGAEYDLSLYKYSISDNRYDPSYAFDNADLEPGEVLLSEFGNLPEPMVGDTLFVSYLYRDIGRRVNEGSIEVYNIHRVAEESVPTNISRFFLKNAPIVNSLNEIPKSGGVSFSTGENSDEAPPEFYRELVFNSSKLPSKVGEFSINYATGEVIVVGATKPGEGTGADNNIAQYLYRNSFTKNLDFYIKDDEFVAASNRSIVGEEVDIDFSYDKVYVEGVDFRAPCHTEVMNEHVANGFESSFVIRPKNTPVTNVFRVFNQTTGEVYSPLYSTDDEIYFTGSRSPEFRTKYNESVSFDAVELEKLSPIGKFVCPAFSMEITANDSNSSIQFSPGIPAELIDLNSQDYFMRSTGLSGGDAIEDLQIRFFGMPDSNNLIHSASINLTATAPSVNEVVTIGPMGAAFSLSNNLLTNKSGDAIASYVNTSIEFSKADLFLREKYFSEITSNPGISRISDGDLASEILSSKGEEFFKNLSRLRRVGDYCVDYVHGQIYLATSYGQSNDLGHANYSHASITPLNTNLMSVTEAVKKSVSSDATGNATVIFENIKNTAESISILDLGSTLTLSEEGVVAPDLDGIFRDTCVVLGDYTVVLPTVASGVTGIYSINSLEGHSLSRSSEDSRVADIASDIVLSPAAEGGGNLYNPAFMSFEEHIVDLKKTYGTRLSLSGDDYDIFIADPEFDKLHKIVHLPTNSEIFDEKLNVVKIDNLDVVATSQAGSDVTVELRSGPVLDSVDISGDFLLDADGSRFRISGFDAALSRVTVNSPAENNVEANAPSNGQASVVVKATVTATDGGVSISIPSDSYVNYGDPIEVIYKTKSTPEVGSKLGVDYRAGRIYVSYVYSYDDVYISYEYGDNEIDWSISSAVSEGEDYYATYKFGALRDALRKNFGILTKIPFFQGFSINTDRELYRSAIGGTMQAFTKGPTIPAFKSLIKSFTDISPEINESIFGSWILGRDHLFPGGIDAQGSLSFGACKFGDGVVIGEDTVISTPSLSNINLNEGTISSWVCPEWSGIDNDATLTIDIDNMGRKDFYYKSGTDVYSYGNNFALLSSSLLVGGLDDSMPSITLHNYDRAWDEAGGEVETIGAFALVKTDEALNRTSRLDLDVSLKVSNFSAPISINPPRRRPSEDVALSVSSLGVLGLGRSLSDASRGHVAAGSEMDLFRFCSPAFVSIGDKNKLLFTLFSLRPLYNPESGRIYTFRVGYDNMDVNEIPEYDRLHITKNCKCTIENTLKDLSKFRNKEFQSIKIEMDSEMDFSYIKDVDVPLDYDPSLFRILDTRGAIYEVYEFLDETGARVSKGVPDSVTGFVVNRIPDNMQHITARGSDAINDTLPTGEITVLYQTISVLTNSNQNATEYLGYEAKNHLVDWMSGFVDFRFVRDPANNNVEIAIKSAIDGRRHSISLFYTDLIDSDQEDVIYSALNLDKWFNVVDGVISVDNVGALADKIAIGTIDQTSKSIIDIAKFDYKVYNRFDKSDIYIGSGARNPRRIPFKVSKYDYPATSSGIPHNADISEGIFIGFDELCASPLAEDVGQWVFRTRAGDSISVPTAVHPAPGGGYVFSYSQVSAAHTFSGKISTDGEFSSVVRAHRDEDGSGCPSGIVCAAEYRYCGNGLLAGTGPSDGWRRLNETDSELVNVWVGGAEGESSHWMRHGSFDTSASNGVYRMGPSVHGVDLVNHDANNGNFVYTSLPCYDGDYSATVSIRVLELDFALPESSIGRFHGAVSGSLTGIVPIHVYDGEINIKVSLAISNAGQPLVLIMDGATGDVVDISYFNWNDGSFNTLSLNKDAGSGILTIESDLQVLSRLTVGDFSSASADVCGLLSEPFIAVNLFDGTQVDSASFHSGYNGNIIDIGLVEYSGRFEDGATTLEDGDIFISTDSDIRFSLTSPGAEVYDGYDGYLSGVVDDGYGYGYLSDMGYDVDEIYFTSDKLRYLFDSGESNSENRISIFKDGKGFMNFRIYDNSLSSRGDVGMYNIATSIKSFKPGELHHISASWRLNTLYGKDEMHLFIDGLEAPNIYKFGGVVPVRINDKFSDISKEVIQDFLVDGIEFYETFTDGTISAGTSVFTSVQAGFTQDMVGRSVLFESSDIAITYIGEEYIINSVSGDTVTFVRGLDLDTVAFDTSASDITFTLPPAAGIKSEIATDLRNSSFSIFKTDCYGSSEELGGILYTVDGGTISIISGSNVINPKYRANIATKVIEFVGRNKDCGYASSVDFSDLDIHIETFGLIYANCKDIINLSSSSYYRLDEKPYDIKSGKSVILAHAEEPVSLKDVYVRRIVMNRTIPALDSSIFAGDMRSAFFEIPLGSSDGSTLLTSQPGQVHRLNSGRYLTINFDSDNVVFCNDEDGYLDEDALNQITVYGETVDGSNEETFIVRGNGMVPGSKLFKDVVKITGSIYIIDEDHEPCVIELVESNPITVSDAGGESAEIFRYSNGSFTLSTAGSSGFHPFELHPGDYNLSYPAFMRIGLRNVGDRAYVGCDRDGKFQFGGTIDELRIITEMSNDTRPTQSDTDGTRSVTEDFLSPNPHCPDDQTLLLAHFDDPIALQARRLRRKEFLNIDDNFKFKLDLGDRESLLRYINDENKFVSTMARMGYELGSARETYIECHNAEGGPLFNEALLKRSGDMLIGKNSVNDSFGMSARFADTQPLVINNRMSHFRRGEGTIEFWVSPILDTLGDEADRYYVDIYSATRKRVKSFSPTIIDLPTPANDIVGIQLLQKTSEFSKFYTQDEADKVLFDEVYRSDVTGRLTGGTGVQKDFAAGAKLSADGKRLFLKEALPGANVDVAIAYIPLDSAGDRVSIYKNERSQVVFSITANGTTNLVCKDVDWNRNTWHRIMCTYRTNSTSDTMRLFVDGSESGYITYGQRGVVYGTGFVYGQTSGSDNASRKTNYNIKLGDDFRLISVGSDIFEKKTALSRMDNLRFSRSMRSTFKDPSGEYIDPNYSTNTDTVMPVVSDDSTTMILNFEKDSKNDLYATVVDPARGIFNFDIEIEDGFGKIDNDEVEDLIVELVDTLKPAHSNALIKFPREPC